MPISASAASELKSTSQDTGNSSGSGHYDGGSVHDDSTSHDHEKSHVDSSTTSFQTATNKDNQSSESSTLVKQETKMVQRSKLLVLFVLFLAMTAVGVLTYIFARNAEQQEFESKFHDFSVEVQELVHHEARNVFMTVQSFSSTITSYALSTKANWPFFDLPHFEIRGREMNNLSKSLLTAFAPYVNGTDQRNWEMFAGYMQDWIQEGVDYSQDLHQEFFGDGTRAVASIHQKIFRYPLKEQDETAELGNDAHNVGHTTVVNTSQPIPVSAADEDILLPVWQMAPAPHDPKIVNYNILDDPVFERVHRGMVSINQPVLSEATDLEYLYGGSIYDDPTHPHSFLLQPVYHDFMHVSDQDILGVIIAVIGWDHYFKNLLPQEAHGIHVVMKDTCGDEFTYVLNGPEAVFVGYGDHHESKFSYLEEASPFDPLHKLNATDDKSHCEYEMHVFPSQELQDDYLTNDPILYTVVVCSVFLMTVMVFVLYDYLVNLRQNKVMLAAKKSNMVVASLFPKNVRDRIMQDVEDQINAGEKISKKGIMFGHVAKHELKNFLDDGIANAAVTAFDTKPIADLFPATTILFGDIVGFTAWSSVREPTQVFQLLETVYAAFDEIAKRRRVFKVETIGDCYVAVAGLPEPRKDHATVMARFARDCLSAMNDLTNKLEISLGPDTGDLSMRVGLHSGPVTAGVLRGDKSRFQLFGDTVNTAARIESTGGRNKIHLSADTAELLRAGGKSHWLVKRDDQVFAKGKGQMETYWLDLKQQSSGSNRSGESGRSGTSGSDGGADIRGAIESLGVGAARESGAKLDSALPPKIKRLVKWNADVLLRILRQVVARREALQTLANQESQKVMSASERNSAKTSPSGSSDQGATVIDEVVEIIELPKFSAQAAKIQKDPKEVELNPNVEQQLHDFIAVIASMYRADVPFHNFEHASHVTMSVVKLLSRIVAPDEVLMADVDDEKEDHEIISQLHDHTYGITSDPLTQFAVVFSALIHDVDHTGAPNAQLIKEGATIASIYKGKSVAEQNSVDLAWSVLCDDSFAELRNTIFATDEERKRFRQLVVNVVLATDIVDKDLKQLRNSRWEKAFKSEQGGVANLIEMSTADDKNRKATIILEHLIQASDIAHTMQHWHIYRKWNEMFFCENLLAFRQGRADKDPTEYWYKGEIGFFDFYIIPLAKKLKECGVFGVSCDEYLNYAMANRKEWEARGEEVVAEMVEKYKTLLQEQEKTIHPIEEE